MPQKLILFDIDDTLFDTDSYREKLYPRLAEKMGYTSEEFLPVAKQVYLDVKDNTGYFSPEVFLQMLLLRKKTDVSLAELEEVFWRNELYTNSMFSQVEEMVKKLAVDGVTIGILSKGDERHQRLKISRLGSSLAEEHIHIFADKISQLPHVLKQYQNWQVYIVDDLLEVLEAAKKIDPTIYTVWVNREKKYENTDLINDFKPDRIINTISELTHGISMN